MKRVLVTEPMHDAGMSLLHARPDIEVVLRSDEVKELLKVQKSNDVLLQAHGGAAEGNERYTIADTLAADPQLAAGLLAVQAKLAQNNELVWKMN